MPNTDLFDAVMEARALRISREQAEQAQALINQRRNELQYDLVDLVNNHADQVERERKALKRAEERKAKRAEDIALGMAFVGAGMIAVAMCL